MLIRIWGRIYYARKKAEVQLLRKEQRNDNNKLRSLILHLRDVWQKKWSKRLEWRLMKNESNLKLLKDKILQVKNFLLFNFVLLSYRERVISKYLTLVLAYISITNNLKPTTTSLTMKPIIRKFQMLIHNNSFRFGILVWHIYHDVFWKKKLINFF